MKDLAKKLIPVEKMIAEEKGSFLLFALFLREDSPNLWDLLVCAPWIEANKGDALQYLVPKLQAVATPDELIRLSHIEIIEKKQPGLAAIQNEFCIEHELIEVNNRTFFDMQISQAYIITSQFESQKKAPNTQVNSQYINVENKVLNELMQDLTVYQSAMTDEMILGIHLVREGQWQKGLQLLLDSIQELRHSDDLTTYANALYQVGRAYETLSDWDNARLYYRDALRLYEHLHDLLGITQSKVGFGSVLISLGYLDKGLGELAQAAEGYHQLQQPEKAAEVETLYQEAQRAIEREKTEVSV